MFPVILSVPSVSLHDVSPSYPAVRRRRAPWTGHSPKTGFSGFRIPTFIWRKNPSNGHKNRKTLMKRVFSCFDHAYIWQNQPTAQKTRPRLPASADTPARPLPPVCQIMPFVSVRKKIPCFMRSVFCFLSSLFTDACNTNTNQIDTYRPPFLKIRIKLYLTITYDNRAVKSGIPAGQRHEWTAPAGMPLRRLSG